MNSNNNLSIELDMNKFKKISKKLQSKIYDKTEHNIKLSVIQEALSESLGFRNYNDFNNQNKDTIEIKKDTETTCSSFLFFDGSINDNRKIAKVLSQNIDTESNYIPSSTLLLLDVIIENYKFFDAYSSALEECKNPSFLTGLFYSFGFMQFNSSEKLELQNDQVIIKYLNSINYSPTQLIRSNDFSDEEASYLKEHSIAYNGLIELLKVINMIKNNNITIYKRIWLAPHDFNNSRNVFYKRDIYQSPFYYKSWLHMDSFYKLIANLDYLSPFSSFKMSDLLLHTANIISPSLKDNMRQLISILIDNYEDCIEISNNLKDI